MGCEACRSQVLVHQPIDLRAEEMGPTALRTGKDIHSGRAVTLPALKSLGDIGRNIDEAIDLPFAVIDAHRPCVQVDRLPRQATGLGDAQATAQHEEKQEAIPEGVNDLKEGHEVRVRERFGQPLRDQKTMLAAADRLLQHRPFVAEIGEHLREDTHLRIERRGSQASDAPGGEKGRDVLGCRVGEIRGQPRVAVWRQSAHEPCQGERNGAQGGRGIALRDELGEIPKETVLIQRTEGREGRLILHHDRTIHSVIS
jgi:hypothetical protein